MSASRATVTEGQTFLGLSSIAACIVLLHFVMVCGHDIIALVQKKARNNPNGCSSEPLAQEENVGFFPFLVVLSGRSFAVLSSRLDMPHH